jgi:3,4-dihydroxy 2-butanone 4-phosphate synthase/GTP cyclohydrolase II
MVIMTSEFTFNSIPEALEDIRQGEMIIVVDDEDRENEGDLVMAAEKITPEAVNFMTAFGRGLVCVSLTADRLEKLELAPMVNDNTARLGTRFTVSVDAFEGTTTGISAQDRAVTIEKLVNENTQPSDLGRPGHIFPLQAIDGGVLRRAGHTEASVDLARLAGLNPAGVLCEIMDDDGSMARVPKLMEFAKKHGLKIVTIHDLILYRRLKEKLVERITSVKLPTQFGDFDLYMYRSKVGRNEHLALVCGDVRGKENVLVRVHSQCLTGDVFSSCRCDCGGQLHAAMRQVQEEGQGVVLYMRQEGRGIGLANKLLAYALQDEGLDTVEANEKLGFKADLRDYGIGAQILVDLGLTTIKLMTNNPKKVVGLEGYGLKIVERVPLEQPTTTYNHRYLETKRDKLGHLLELKGI